MLLYGPWECGLLDLGNSFRAVPAAVIWSRAGLAGLGVPGQAGAGAGVQRLRVSDVVAGRE
jgi:hypothetical protein